MSITPRGWGGRHIVGEREGLVPFIVIGYDAERRPLVLVPQRPGDLRSRIGEPARVQLVVRADEAVPYGRVMDVLALLPDGPRKARWLTSEEKRTERVEGQNKCPPEG